MFQDCDSDGGPLGLITTYLEYLRSITSRDTLRSLIRSFNDEGREYMSRYANFAYSVTPEVYAPPEFECEPSPEEATVTNSIFRRVESAPVVAIRRPLFER